MSRSQGFKQRNAKRSGRRKSRIGSGTAKTKMTKLKP